MKQIKIHIRPDGLVQAETLGVKGEACTDYIKVLEELLDAEAVHSAYKPEYFQSEEVSLEVRSENQGQTTDGVRLQGENR